MPEILLVCSLFLVPCSFSQPPFDSTCTRPAIAYVLKDNGEIFARLNGAVYECNDTLLIVVRMDQASLVGSRAAHDEAIVKSRANDFSPIDSIPHTPTEDMIFRQYIQPYLEQHGK